MRYSNGLLKSAPVHVSLPNKNIRLDHYGRFLWLIAEFGVDTGALAMFLR